MTDHEHVRSDSLETESEIVVVNVQSPWKRRTVQKSWNRASVRFALMSSDMITLVAQGTSLVVHKALLCTFSEHWQASLEKSTTAAKLELDDVSLDVVKSLICWMYTGHLIADVDNMSTASYDKLMLDIPVYATDMEIPSMSTLTLHNLQYSLGEHCESQDPVTIFPLELVNKAYIMLAGKPELLVAIVECYAGNWQFLSHDGSLQVNIKNFDATFLCALLHRQDTLRRESRHRKKASSRESTRSTSRGRGTSAVAAGWGVRAEFIVASWTGPVKSGGSVWRPASTSSPSSCERGPCRDEVES